MIHLSDLYHDHSTVLTSKYLSAEGIGGKAGNEPVPDSGNINGVGQYPHSHNGEILFPSYSGLVVEPSKSYRLRLVNAGTFAPIKFSIDSHKLTVIETDGIEVEPITFTEGIKIEVGQRYSVIVHAHKHHGEKYWIRASLVTDEFKYHGDETVNEVLDIMAYGEELEGVPTSEQESKEVLDLNRLRPLVPTTPPPATRTYIVDYQLSQTPEGNTVGMFNSTPWSPLHPSSSLLDNLGDVNDGPSVPKPYQFLISVNKPEVIDLIIDNLSEGTYPFSLNGHLPWIMKYGSGRYNGPSSNTSLPDASTAGSKLPTSNESYNNSSSTTSSSPSQAAPSNPQTNQSGYSTPPQNNNSGSTASHDSGQISSNSKPHSNSNKNSYQNSSKESSKKKHPSHADHKDNHHHTSSKGYTSSQKQKPSPSTSQKYPTKLSHAALQVHEPYKVFYSGGSRSQYEDQTPKIFFGKVRRQLPPVAMQRDTFTVLKDGWVMIRFVADNPGIWQLSDQTQWHLAAGGAMQISSRKAEWPKAPEEIQKFCSSSDKLTT